MPEIDPDNPSIYVTLASVIPPASPYKPKPHNSMFVSHLFADVNYNKTFDDVQIYDHDDWFGVPGSHLKLASFSALLLDIKKFDLAKGTMTDYAFALQPLIHSLKGRYYLIGGRYQVPIYKGCVPYEMFASIRDMNVKKDQHPRVVMKKLIESKKIELLNDSAQIVTDVEDLNPPDDVSESEDRDEFPIPSMLHHIDKNELEKFIIEEDLEILKDGADELLAQGFAPKLNNKSQFKTPQAVSSGVKALWAKNFR